MFYALMVITLSLIMYQGIPSLEIIAIFDALALIGFIIIKTLEATGYVEANRWD